MAVRGRVYFKHIVKNNKLMSELSGFGLEEKEEIETDLTPKRIVRQFVLNQLERV